MTAFLLRSVFFCLYWTKLSSLDCDQSSLVLRTYHITCFICILLSISLLKCFLFFILFFSSSGFLFYVSSQCLFWFVDAWNASFNVSIEYQFDSCLNRITDRYFIQDLFKFVFISSFYDKRKKMNWRRVVIVAGVFQIRRGDKCCFVSFFYFLFFLIFTSFSSSSFLNVFLPVALWEYCATLVCTSSQSQSLTCEVCTVLQWLFYFLSLLMFNKVLDKHWEPSVNSLFVSSSFFVLFSLFSLFFLPFSILFSPYYLKLFSFQFACARVLEF